jgi:DHA1 family bicyclomycin/chloramphenicol resistance-like MFS transporter
MISGMMLGAFASGRLAGRVSGPRLAGIGFAVCGAAAVLNLIYNLLVDTPSLPLGVAPMVLNAFGIALVFPILTLAILDLYPRQRGAASSLQAFISLGFNALLAGLVSPWVSGSGLQLAVMASAFTSIAWLLWWGYLRHCRKMPSASVESVPLQPTDQL